MTQRKLVRAKSFTSVGAGQTAALDLPTTYVYHCIQVKHYRSGVAATEAQMKADMKKHRLKINNKTQREFTTTQLFTIQAMRGLAVTAGIIAIWLGKPWARDGQGEDALAWGTADVESFQLEIDIDAAAVAPTLSAKLLVEDGANRPIGAIEQWTSHTLSSTGAGLLDYSPVIEPYQSYYGLECFTTLITDVDVRRDGDVKFEGTPEEFNSTYKDQGLVPQAGLTSILWDHTDRASDSLPLSYIDAAGQRLQAKSFPVKFTCSGAGSFEVISRRLGLPV